MEHRRFQLFCKTCNASKGNRPRYNCTRKYFTYVNALAFSRLMIRFRCFLRNLRSSAPYIMKFFKHKPHSVASALSFLLLTPRAFLAFSK